MGCIAIGTLLPVERGHNSVLSRAPFFHKRADIRLFLQLIRKSLTTNLGLKDQIEVFSDSFSLEV